MQFVVGVSWRMLGTYVVEAESPEEARKIVQEGEAEMPLPDSDSSDYAFDSLVVDTVMDMSGSTLLDCTEEVA